MSLSLQICSDNPCPPAGEPAFAARTMCTPVTQNCFQEPCPQYECSVPEATDMDRSSEGSPEDGMQSNSHHSISLSPALMLALGSVVYLVRHN